MRHVKNCRWQRSTPWATTSWPASAQPSSAARGHGLPSPSVGGCPGHVSALSSACLNIYIALYCMMSLLSHIWCFSLYDGPFPHLFTQNRLFQGDKRGPRTFLFIAIRIFLLLRNPCKKTTVNSSLPMFAPLAHANCLDRPFYLHWLKGIKKYGGRPFCEN